MRLRFLSILLLGVTLAAAGAPGTAGAWTRPDFELTLGRTLGANDTPNDGGLSVAVAPMWTAADRAHFGVSVFADDIGTHLATLRDPNVGTDLGVTADLHRWTWGVAWRGDLDVIQRKRWAGGLSAQMGWWRILDDVRGGSLATASDVGLAVGANVRRTLTGDHEVGVAGRWQRLFDQRNSAYRRADGYATLALEWRWNAPRHP